MRNAGPLGEPQIVSKFGAEEGIPQDTFRFHSLPVTSSQFEPLSASKPAKV